MVSNDRPFPKDVGSILDSDTRDPCLHFPPLLLRWPMGDKPSGCTQWREDGGPRLLHHGHTAQANFNSRSFCFRVPNTGITDAPPSLAIPLFFSHIVSQQQPLMAVLICLVPGNCIYKVVCLKTKSLPSCPGTHSAHQTGLKLGGPPATASRVLRVKV